MHTYSIVITYSINTQPTPTGGSLTIRRKAATPGAAGAAAAAIFQALCNVTVSDGATPPTYSPYLEVTNVAVNEIS